MTSFKFWIKSINRIVVYKYEDGSINMSILLYIFVFLLIITADFLLKHFSSTTQI